MNGSIRFNDDINIEVAVDPTAEEGTRLTGAKNLVDGQELGTGGGADLPVVTEADAGKVLAVNASGEWAATEKILVINCTNFDGSEPTLNSSKLNYTYKEIAEAINSGAAIILQFSNPYSSPSYKDGNICSAIFITEMSWDETYYIMMYNISAEQAYTFSADTIDDELLLTYMGS